MTLTNAPGTIRNRVTVTRAVTHSEGNRTADPLPFTCTARRHPAQPSAEVAAPSFFLVASRVVTADRLDVLLRTDHVGDPATVKAAAVALLVATAERCGVPCCVDVVDGRGCPIFFASAAGGAL